MRLRPIGTAALAVSLLAGTAACAARQAAPAARARTSVPAAPVPSPVLFTGPLPSYRPAPSSSAPPG